jgi:hypothetical protein
MNSVNSGYIVFGIIALLIVIVIISIIKKAIKLVIFVIVIILGFSAYNVLVKGVSPIDEIQGYKTNIQYGRSITDYTVKVKTSVGNIKDAVEGKKIDGSFSNIIKSESANLNKYEAEALTLKHTKKLDGFHQQYCNYLKAVVDSAEAAYKVANIGDGKNMAGVLDKLNSSFNQLTNLNIK